MFNAFASCEMATVLVKLGPFAHSTRDLLAPSGCHEDIYDPRQLTRGNTKMRTGENVAANTENPRDNDEPHSPFPKVQEAWEPIEQLAKEEQVGRLNRKDDGPADNIRGQGQLPVPEDTVSKARRRGLLQL